LKIVKKEKLKPNINESFLDFNSKNDYEFENSEENTNKSLMNNSKVKFFKRNSGKNKKSDNQQKKIAKDHIIDIKNNLSEICCSNKVNEKCLIF